MGSSGIIYAIIVGAWAVYLVPMWLRREDELNRARQTQRYAAAIKVLANKEAFERRWAQSNEADEALPLAVGQGSVAVSAPRATKRATGKGTSAPQGTVTASSAATKPTKRPVVAAAATTAATASRRAVTAKIAPTDTRSAHTARSRAATPTAATAPSGTPGTPALRPSRASGLNAPMTRTRTGLMARRRRVVALLFAFSTLGALASADLGARYLWVMAIPAVLLSAYIARLRREERIRATARAAKFAAAQQAREARETEFARAEAVAAEAARVEASEAEAMRVQARTETEQRRRAEAARRRASAAARARAQVYTQEAPDLRQASNG